MATKRKPNPKEGKPTKGDPLSNFDKMQMSKPPNMDKGKMNAIGKARAMKAKKGC